MKKKILELTIKENPKLEEMLCDILIYLSNKQDGIYSEYRILENFKETFIKYYREKANIDDKDLSIKLGRKENFIYAKCKNC